MESTITGTIESVTGRTVNTSRGSAPIFDIMIGSQKVSTFKAPVAEEAKALQGSVVNALVDVSQKGDYTNHTLLGVKVAPTTTASGIPLAPAISPESRGGHNDARQESIVRQSSVKAAFHYAAALGESVESAFTLAEQIFQWCQGGSNEEQVLVAFAEVGATEVSDNVPW